MDFWNLGETPENPSSYWPVSQAELRLDNNHMIDWNETSIYLTKTIWNNRRKNCIIIIITSRCGATLFVIVMYCIITTCSVECYWHCSDGTVHYKSDKMVHFCDVQLRRLYRFINVVFLH